MLLCELIFRSVHLLGGMVFWFYERNYREQTFTAVCHAKYRNESYTGLLSSG